MRKSLVLTIVFVFVSGITLSSIMASAQEDYNIPAWIKNNAAWWSQGQIDDASFVSGITYMIENGIMEISQSNTPVNNMSLDDLYQENQEFREYFENTLSDTVEYARNEQVLSEQIFSLEAQLQAAQNANTAGSSSVQKIQDNGDFYIVYVPSDTYPDYEAWVKNGMNNYPNFFDEVADWLNQIYRLPYDVPIFFHECDMTNAYYNSDAKEIVLCYELVKDYHTKMYYAYSHTDDAFIGYATLSAVDYVFYHELAHALIDIYDLRITGLEEDVADQYSAYMLAEFGTDENIGSDEIQFAAIVNALSHSEAQFQPSAFADTHSLSIQRYYNLMCYAYGNDPVYNANILESPFFPGFEQRAPWCESEYAQIVNTWDYLLVPFLK